MYGRIEGFIFVLLCYLYTKKTSFGWGWASPVFRGLQSFILVAGLTGYGAFLPWLAFALTLIRNFLGDIRDIKKDKKHGMRTLPMVLGMAQGWKYIHLAGVMITSLVWWSLADISIGYLLAAYVVQIATYNLTPR